MGALLLQRTWFMTGLNSGFAFADLGKIDVVVNNAGYGLFGAIEEFTDEQILHQVSTNLLGSMNVIRAALPHLRGQGGGRILKLSTELPAAS